MEGLIAKLLENFEQGRMTRRQLIQSLALAATAAASGSAASAPLAAAPAGGKGFRATGVNHISYEVADYRKIRDFYADLLGMKISQDNGKQCFLTFGETLLIPRNRASRTPRIDHVAYMIDDWDRNEVEAELKRRGLQPRADTANSFHVSDPAGFDLQICGKDFKA